MCSKFRETLLFDMVPFTSSSLAPARLLRSHAEATKENSPASASGIDRLVVTDVVVQVVQDSALTLGVVVEAVGGGDEPPPADQGRAAAGALRLDVGRSWKGEGTRTRRT